MLKVGIIGTGRYVPESIVKNDDLSMLVETNDEWIYSRTGIRERHISFKEDTSVLAYNAGKEALESAGIKPEEIDLIIVATCTPDYNTPSTSCIVQEKIGAINAFAFDLNAACAGFIYATITASKFIASGQYKKALVVGVDLVSKLIDWNDRNTCILFGDGAGAAVISQVSRGGFGAEDIRSDGRMSMAITGGKNPNITSLHEKAPFEKNYLQMNSKAVWDFAVRKVPVSIQEVLHKSGLTLDDIKYVIPHQANTRIIDYIAKRLSAPREKFYTNMEHYSNTSAGSVPIALDELNKNGYLNEGDKIIVCGFGGGVTWGSLVVEW